MGNYYEGKLTIPLKKDIPEELKIALINMCYWQEKMQIPKQWKESPIFQHEKFSHLRISYGYVFRDGDTDFDIFSFEYMGHNDEETSAYLEEVWDLLDAYYVEVNICLKGYKNIGEQFVEWIRPWIDSRYNYLGRIKDEDCTYCKDFFVDEELFKEENKKRLIICEGCDIYSPDCLCDNYQFCERAYNKGKNEK